MSRTGTTAAQLATRNYNNRSHIHGILPVKAAGCSRKGTLLDLASRENVLVPLALGAVNDRAEPMTARTIVARIMIGTW